MTALTEKIYFKAPYVLKKQFASAHAAKLDRSCFGPEYRRIASEIERRNHWSSQQFRNYQVRQLITLLHHAVHNVPYYRQAYKTTRAQPDKINHLDDITRLPILEREIVRSDPVSLLDETLNPKKLIKLHTSGTTGTPLTLFRNIWLNSAARAYFDVRCRALAGVKRKQNPSVSIGGHIVTDPNRTTPPFWVLNKRWKQLYMSSYHLAPDFLGSYIDEIRTFQPDYIEGYPSSVYALARFILENNLPAIPLKACFTTAETLFTHQRHAIRKAFACDTWDQYGCGEMAVFAAQCPHGAMHLSPEYGIVEVLDQNDQPLPTGQTGQLVCTSLINRVQPFIRYRLGDVGSLSDQSCLCQSPLPILAQIQGRMDDTLVTQDGKQIGRLDPVFKNTAGIIEAQIVQNDYHRFLIRVVPDKQYNQRHADTLIDNLARRTGQADIRIELVDKIERTAAGKFKAVICNVPRQNQASAKIPAPTHT